MKKIILVIAAVVASAMVVSCGRNTQKAAAQTETAEVSAAAPETCAAQTAACEKKAECASDCENCPKAQGQPCDGTCGCETPGACAAAACGTEVACEGEQCPQKATNTVEKR